MAGHDAADEPLAISWAKPGILVGIDGSDAARNALEYAVRVAPKLDLPVHALVVWSYPSLAWADAYPYSVPLEALERDAEEMASREVGRLFPSQTPEWLTTGARQGMPARELIRASGDAAMLVVGTRGHGGFAGLVMGSVSSACAAHARCPVLVVPAEHGSR